ncbi:MAG TPA: adenylate/guanylate cyclase domain-containing protein, partial [Candidatus Methylomirabilis sp.]|nr:adenylate/guanylate cyclase domain-containing protein [Candidatus Methylomirabilis sp.]
MMRITYSFQGKQTIFERETTQVVVGRPSPSVTVDLDLRPDFAVSRPHARVWTEDGHYWIEDLNSLRGTLVGGEEIRGKGKRQLHPGDLVRMGETTLQVDIPAEPAWSPASQPLFAHPPPVEIATTLDATVRVPVPMQGPSGDAGRRLALLYELPLQFGAEARSDTLLQTIVERLVEVIPGATRGALLLRQRETDQLLLKAYVSPDQPAVSETLARRVMGEGKACIWRRSEEADAGVTILQQRTETGMYAPLLWQGEALGAICVDNPQHDTAFSDDDLRLMLAVAQYAAMALANQQLQERLRRESGAKATLLRQFSPKIAERLIGQHGRPRLASQRGEVTILCSDIRGFTKLSRDMEPDDVVEMLNDYYAQLIPVIFSHDGTVDKYIGDAILAVFGSPEPDPKHLEKGVRTALEMQTAMRGLNLARRARGQVTCDIGIGIHCGEVVHGFIGSAERKEFSVIGDAVNLTSRYCDGA